MSRRSIDGILSATGASVSRVDGQIDVAAAAAMDFPDDPVAVEHHPRLQQRRQRQFGTSDRRSRRLARRGTASMRTIWTVRLSVTAAPVGLLDDRLRRRVQIARRCSSIALGDEARADIFIDAVGRQQKDVALSRSANAW